MNSVLTITSPASSLSLLTTAELRAAAGLAAGDASQDPALATLGLRLSAAIARACGIASDGVNTPTLLRETCSEMFRSRQHATTLRLSRRPVTSITSVVENDEALDAAAYEVNPASGLFARLCDDRETCWPCGKITVVYVAGLGTVPEDLKLAASKLATALKTEAGRDPSTKRVIIPDVREVEYWVAPSDDPLLSAEISDLLAPYKQYW